MYIIIINKNYYPHASSYHFYNQYYIKAQQKKLYQVTLKVRVQRLRFLESTKVCASKTLNRMLTNTDLIFKLGQVSLFPNPKYT